MSDRPGPLRRLDNLIGAMTIAHEEIADLHFIAPDERSLRAVRESAEILFRRMPAVAGGVRVSAIAWEEQALLDPDRAAETLRRIEAQMVAVEAELGDLLRRQAQIARDLREGR